MAEEIPSQENDDRPSRLAILGATLLFVVGVVMVVDATRIVLFRPDLLTQPLFELVAIVMGVLAMLYAGVIFSRVVHTIR